MRTGMSVIHSRVWSSEVPNLDPSVLNLEYIWENTWVCMLCQIKWLCIIFLTLNCHIFSKQTVLTFNNIQNNCDYGLSVFICGKAFIGIRLIWVNIWHLEDIRQAKFNGPSGQSSLSIRSFIIYSSGSPPFLSNTAVSDQIPLNRHHLSHSLMC